MALPTGLLNLGPQRNTLFRFKQVLFYLFRFWSPCLSQKYARYWRTKLLQSTFDLASSIWPYAQSLTLNYPSENYFKQKSVEMPQQLLFQQDVFLRCIIASSECESISKHLKLAKFGQIFHISFFHLMNICLSEFPHCYTNPPPHHQPIFRRYMGH